jgi:[ribosomal protein S18]-alanine N-acetyltransferase
MKTPLGWRSPSPIATPRALRPSDGAACARLHATSFAHPWPMDEFESLLLDSACVADGLEKSSALAGFILSRRALDEAEVLTIVVDARLRRQGCGQRLLGAHIARLARLGVACLFLEVDESNAAALALYRRNGFVQAGMRKAYYARPDGSRANALVMRRSLA